ncbi:Biosynthetic arginine decarboxylase [Arsenophonus endosymbiont of Bemisia tabaci Q2]|nr:Biosynthetic arginine decarboxylase [Arsenophonus endosymbiont of Bemisia tabaci Q2]
MLHYVKLDPNMLLTLFGDQVNSKDLTKSLKEQFLAEFETGLYGYTYLEGESI